MYKLNTASHFLDQHGQRYYSALDGGVLPTMVDKPSSLDVPAGDVAYCSSIVSDVFQV